MTVSWRFVLKVLFVKSVALGDDLSSSSQCELYIATSTIPNAGLGVFTTVRKEIDDSLGNGDVALPLFNFYRNNDKKGFFYPFIDYVWDGTVMGMEQEVSEKEVEAYWPGLDCMINCNLALVNAGKASPMYDTGGLHRATHPGAGAISPYHNGTSKAIRPIPPGGELFKFYGDDWFMSRFRNFGNIPLLNDYDTALQLLNKFSRTNQIVQPNLYDLVVTIKKVWDSRRLNAIPNVYDEALLAIQQQDLGVVHQPNATRSVDWLHENGKCIDNIVPGRSTIDGAGHGAFAKRSIPAGTIITASPLHHVPDRRLFHLYEFELDKGGKERRTEHKIGEQVVVNYCFGHVESSLLLCPYGSGINYINHNKTQANVKVQWPKDGEVGHNSSWLETMTPADMMWKFKQSLALDYVATKQIDQGEELFMDYGDVWEKSWKSHVQNWTPLEDWKACSSAAEFNKEHAKLTLRTDYEQKVDPYPENLQMRCHHDLIEKRWRGKRFSWLNEEKGYPCRVLRRNRRNPYLYNVVIFSVKNDKEPNRQEYNRTGVPREAISFVDVPSSTDLHLFQAFRQPLGLPDELMPQAWRNQPIKSSSI